MARMEFEKGLLITPDIYFATILTCRGAKITGTGKNRAVDLQNTLPSVELSHCYIRVIERPKQRKDKRRRRNKKARLEYTTTRGSAGAPRQQEMVRIPLVVFAFKPYKGTHELAKKKNDYLHHGRLWTDTLEYQAQHERLRRRIRRTVQNWRRETGRTDARVKERGVTQELHGAEGRIVIPGQEVVADGRSDGPINED